MERQRRHYRLNARAIAVDRTRQRILAAARKEFADAGSRPPSVERIAGEAGVARTTVYGQFGSRLGLIEAVVMDAVRKTLPDVIKASFNPDARQAVLLTVRHGSRLWAHDVDLYANLFALGATDSDAAALIQLNEQNRRRDLDRLVRRVAGQRQLREGLPIEDAVELMMVLTSFPTFHALHRTGGRPVEGVISMLEKLVEGGLLRAAHTGDAPLDGGSRGGRRSTSPEVGPDPEQ